MDINEVLLIVKNKYPKYIAHAVKEGSIYWFVSLINMRGSDPTIVAINKRTSAIEYLPSLPFEIREEEPWPIEIDYRSSLTQQITLSTEDQALLDRANEWLRTTKEYSDCFSDEGIFPFNSSSNRPEHFIWVEIFAMRYAIEHGCPIPDIES